MKTPIRIATRGSKLALWQTNYIGDQLRGIGFEPEKVVIKTTGDRVQDRYLHEIGGKGLFVKELETALLNNGADIAMHSLKDLPARTPEPFILPAILKRHPSADAIIVNQKKVEEFSFEGTVSRDQFAKLGEVTIATSSLRRECLLKQCNPNIRVVPVRGNVDTRLEKLAEGQFDAIILAEASLFRLGIDDVASYQIDPKWFIPSSSQGALAIESRKDYSYVDRIRELSCATTTHQVSIERGTLAALGGDCTMPVGCHVFPHNDQMSGQAIVLDRQGHSAQFEHTATVQSTQDEEAFIRALVEGLDKAGVGDVLRRENISTDALERFLADD